MRAARGERNELSYATRPRRVMRNDPELMSYTRLTNVRARARAQDQLPGQRDRLQLALHATKSSVCGRQGANADADGWRVSFRGDE